MIHYTVILPLSNTCSMCNHSFPRCGWVCVLGCATECGSGTELLADRTIPRGRDGEALFLTCRFSLFFILSTLRFHIFVLCILFTLPLHSTQPSTPPPLHPSNPSNPRNPPIPQFPNSLNSPSPHLPGHHSRARLLLHRDFVSTGNNLPDHFCLLC